jgi:hypothetical protein
MALTRAKAKSGSDNEATPAVADTSYHAALTLLARIKATNDPTEIRRLSGRLEHVIFHKQFKNAKT